MRKTTSLLALFLISWCAFPLARFLPTTRSPASQATNHRCAGDPISCTVTLRQSATRIPESSACEETGMKTHGARRCLCPVVSAACQLSSRGGCGDVGAFQLSGEFPRIFDMLVVFPALSVTFGATGSAVPPCHTCLKWRRLSKRCHDRFLDRNMRTRRGALSDSYYGAIKISSCGSFRKSWKKTSSAPTWPKHPCSQLRFRLQWSKNYLGVPGAFQDESNVANFVRNSLQAQRLKASVSA